MGGQQLKILDGVKRGWRSLVAVLPPKARKPIAWTVGLILFYTIFGFLILPLIVRAVAVKQLSKQFDREVSIRQLRINPYVLSTTIRGLLIKDKDGEPFISWDELYVNFQLSSLVRKPWVFKEFHIIDPYIRGQVNKDYTLNCSDLLKKFSTTTTTNAGPKRLLYLEIDLLKITGARVSLTDLTPNTPFRRIIGPVEITLTKFQTDPASKNPYAFEGTTDGGEKFSWSGYFFLDPLRSGGDVSLAGLSLPKYAPLYEDLVRFEIRSGFIAGRATYQFAMTSSNYLASVTNASFTLKSFKVGAPDATNNFVELASLAVDKVAADMTSRTFEAGNISVSGGHLAVERERDESVNLINMSLPSASATNRPGGILVLLQAATNAFGALIGSTNLWSATLEQIDATNCSLHLVDLANSRPVNLDLDDISLTAQHLSNVPGSNQTAALALRWNTNGSVRVGTSLQIAPPSAEVTMNVSDLELRPLDPYLEPFVNLFLRDSKLSMDGTIRMQMGTNNLPDVSFKGDGRLDDFSSVDSVTTEELLKWKSLSLSGIDATLLPPAVAARQIDLVEPAAHVVFETNNNLNVMTVLKVSGTNIASTSDTEASKPAAPKKQSMGQRLGGILRQVLAGNTNAAGQAAMPKMTVGTLVISNGVVQFDDRSVQPPVAVTVEQIEGTLANISSEELKRADVHLTAKAGPTSAIELTGKINPLSKDAPTEMQVLFKNVELIPTSPYSGKFLGYKLNRGKLGMDMNYQVSQRHLTAKNVITVDYLTLGEKVNSPDAVHLPVRLAIALLKDRNGKIELNVPVEGNLDDPQFHFGKVIMHVIGNLLTKLVTSPFSVLGALFGGKGEEVSYQDFQPGSAEVQAANQEKLEALAKGLYERPGLQVEIESGFDPVADRDAVRKQKLLLSFREQKWSLLRKSEQAQLKPEQVTLSPEEYSGYLRAAYSAGVQAGTITNLATGANPPTQTKTTTRAARPPQPAKMTATEKGATALMKQEETVPAAQPDAMEQSVLETVKVSDDELNQLAAQRAKVLQQKLLETGKIEAERITLAAPESPTNRAARVYFHLQ